MMQLKDRLGRLWKCIRSPRDCIRGRRLRRLAGMTRDRFQRFRGLKSLEPETKSRIRPTVQHYQAQIAVGKYKLWRTQDVLAWLSFIACMVSVWGAPYWVRELFYNPGRTTIVKQAFGAHALATVGFMFLLAVIMELVPTFYRYIWFTILLICIVVFSNLIYPLSKAPPDFVTFTFASILFGQICFLGALFVILNLLRLVRYIFNRAQQSFDPDAVITDGLVQILSDLENKRRQWTFVSFR
jgi:hypothetical protein